ncbi:MAG TPA: hypothetical protein VL688_11100 [Verrucomicrobiae bacterium]|jgi:hypothetical protein|nr:hypothetical protein [Verrucomicrobiae bacterium]
MIPIRRKTFLVLLLAAAVLNVSPATLIWGNDLKDEAVVRPAVWQDKKTGEETEPKTVIPPALVFTPARLPANVIPAKKPVLFPRNQKVRVIPPQPIQVIRPLAKVYPTPFQAPAKAVSVVQVVKPAEENP